MKNHQQFTDILPFIHSWLSMEGFINESWKANIESTTQTNFNTTELVIYFTTPSARKPRYIASVELDSMRGNIRLTSNGVQRI